MRGVGLPDGHGHLGAELHSEPGHLPGERLPTVSLNAYGGDDDVWLFQSGQPQSANLLVEATQANPTFPASGR